MKNSVAIAFVVLSGLSAVASAAPPKATLLILSKRDQSLRIVDPVTLRVLAKEPVGNDPHEVVASADGTRAYVSNYGFGAYHTLAVIDLTRRKPLAPIDLGALRGPHGLTFVGGKVWFTAEAAKALGRFDPKTGKVDLVLGTGQNRTHMIVVSPDGKRVVATNVASGTVSVFEQSRRGGPGGPPPGGRGGPGGPGGPGGRGGPGGPGGPPPRDGRGRGPGGPPPGPGGPGGGADWDQTVVRVGSGSEGFDVSPDRREAWIANAEDGTISVIDLAAKRVVQTIQADARGANRLKFTPDGKRVLVSNLDGPDVVVFDVGTRKAIRRVPVGNGSAGIVVQPDGARAFVACSPDDVVVATDLRTYRVVGRIKTGGEPDGLAWAVRP